jgi:DNA-binding NarL/FixJ family response regulator
VELDLLPVAERAATGVETGRVVSSVMPNDWVATDPLRLVVANDSIVEALGMAAILSRFPDLQVARPTCGTHEALRVALEVRPDVVLVGLGLEPDLGLALLRELRRRVPNARLVAFATARPPALVQAAYTAGAVAFVLRDEDPEKLHLALQAARANHDLVVPELGARLHAESASAAETAMNEVLTRREIEVLQLIAAGCSSREIARQLGIRLATVNAHRASMMKKLNIHKAVGLAQYWLRRSASPI